MQNTFRNLRLWKVAAAVLAGALSQLAYTAPAAATTMSYSFTYDNCDSGGCGYSDYGTVAVSDLTGGGGVHVDVSLTPGIGFIQSGTIKSGTQNHKTRYAFAFSLAGAPDITIANLSNPAFGVGDATGGSPNIRAGGKIGKFEYGVTCTGCNPNNPYNGPLAFDITTPSVTTSSFAPSHGGTAHIPGGIYFVADISTSNCNTGRVAAPKKTVKVYAPPPPSNVPEPATLALFGGALAGLGALRRRRRRKA